ncbi:MAG TPA: NAD-dependent epimerase/dehydratase family protein [Bacteroidia bacterium]|nr:NAD-dependent epimerase/dehydratase family protein [Bacteroidia bacterium]
MILVTGGTGLVGTHLLYDLTKSGEKLRVIKRSNSNIANVKKVFSYYTSDVDSLLNKIEWVDADLLDVYSLMEVMEGVEQIYHCAAMVSFEKKHLAEMMKINVEGTANMVNAALEKGIKKFCHVSSIASLGRAERGEQTSEETFWKSSPENSNYSITKYAAEREVWRAAEEGLNVVIVNPSLILGGGNWTQSSSNMFTKAYKGIKFYSDGTNGFVDVRDVSTIMIKLMESDISNQRFLLNGENASFKHYFEMIHEAFGKAHPRIKAGKFFTGFAWRAEMLRAFVTGSVPLITKETSRSANRQSSFSNKKILKTFPGYQFITLAQSINDTCALYLKDLKRPHP